VPATRNLLLPALSSVLVLLALPLAGAAERWVAPDGDDGNPGTRDAPWRTIQHAAEVAEPGDVVNVREGTYAEQVTVLVSGTEDAPIVFRAAPGEHPVIDGSTLPVPEGDSALVEIADRDFVHLVGLEIRSWKTTDPDRFVIGAWVHGGCRGIVLENLHVHDIRHDDAQGGANAIGVYGDAATPVRDLVIRGCEVNDCTLAWSEAITINGNVDGFLVEGNRVHDVNNIGIDAIGGEGTGPVDDAARNGTIRDNLVWNVSSVDNPAYNGERSAGGIYVDCGTDIVIERNRVHHADLGIEVGCEHSGREATRVTVRSNVLWNCWVTGIAFGGYDTSVGWTTDTTITGNTLWKNDTTASGTGEMMVQRARNVTLRENLLVTTDQAIGWTNWFGPADTVDVTFRDDLVHSPGGGDTTFVWHDEEYGSLAELQSGAGQETGSIADDPRLLAPEAAEPDFHLAPGSPAIDGGNPGDLPPADATDMDGEPRLGGAALDLGADECHAAAAVAGLALRTLAGGATELTWPARAGEASWDVARGDVAALRSSGGDFSAATETCLGDDLAEPRTEDPDTPATGAAWWYLVRAATCGGAGTWDSPVPAGQAASRDPGLAAAPAGCP